MGRPSKIEKSTLVEILNLMVMQPMTALNWAAQKHGISAATIYRYGKMSLDAERAKDMETPLYLEWQPGHRTYWHRAVDFARKISISNLDATIRESAAQPHKRLLSNQQTGEPHWTRDPKIAADALSMDQFDWEMEYGTRKRTDTFVRDADGALVQAFELVPPNSKLLMDAAKALHIDYKETIKHEHQIGGVLRIGVESAPQLAPPIEGEFTELPPPTNILAVGERAKSTDEFEQTFGGKRLVEAVLFYNDDGKLKPPRDGVVIVLGSSVHRKYSEAGIATSPIAADDLIGKGYKNEFLLKLATRPMSDLEKDLRAKLAEPPKHPHPTAAPAYTRDAKPSPVTAPRDPDAWRANSDKDHVGYGAPKAGGVKVV